MYTAENSKTYTGTKVILGWPMTRNDYNVYRGWGVPSDENPADSGYLVEYTDGGKSNHPNHVGYISWSPADVFERAYSESGDWRSRAEAELKQLNDRIAALTAFLLSDDVAKLSPDERGLLGEQKYHMHGYANVLHRRTGVPRQEPLPFEPSDENLDDSGGGPIDAEKGE